MTDFRETYYWRPVCEVLISWPQLYLDDASTNLIYENGSDIQCGLEFF